jgi:hypothetical protein
MTSNPLKMTASGRATREPLQGDMVTIRRVNKDGQEIAPPLVFQRTARPYVQDLCQAYNDNSLRDDVEWYVTEAGDIRIGTPDGFTARMTRDLKRGRERERQEWIRNHRDEP